MAGLLGGCVALCGAVSADDDGSRRDGGLLEVEKAVEITVRARGNPLDPVVAIAGVLTLRVRPADGRFTGWITPGFRVPYGSQPGTAGAPLDSVLFRVVDDAFVADPAVPRLRVDGQLGGRGINMVVHDVLGPGDDIFAQGTTEHFTGARFARDPGRIAGPGVGPLLGDSVDWAVRSETVCVRSVRLQPIRDDGSGGDVTEAIDCISIRSVTLQPVP
jgi:hypothetical protein